jgi:hypothetical protein
MNPIGFLHSISVRHSWGKIQGEHERSWLVMAVTKSVQAARQPGTHDSRVWDLNPGWSFGLGENGAAAAGPSGPKGGPLGGLHG